MSRLKNAVILAAAALLFAILVFVNFRELTNVNVALEAGDAPLYWAHQVKKMFQEGVFASANPAAGMGGMGPIVVGDHTALFYYLLPEAKVEEAIMAFAVFLAAFFFFLFLRERGYGPGSALIGGLALGFSVALLSIAKAGHTGKFTGIAFVSGAMWLMGRALARDKMIWAAFAGFFMGLALAQARDVALIVGVGVGVFWLRELIVRVLAEKSAARWVVARYAVAVAAAIVTAWPVMSVLAPKGEAAPAAGRQDDKRRQWEWATQWSLPSDELMKLIVPSYCGWDSWDPKAPYWGRMGRSDGWERTHQGFRNFTQTNEYIGVTVFVLALAGLFGFLPRWRQQRLSDEGTAPPADTLFWGVLGLIALLLALGKYFPLYKVFYALPMMSSIRNPVKFMHIVCFAVAVLAAQGAYLIERLLAGEKVERRRLIVTLLVAGGGVTLFMILATISAPWDSKTLNARWLTDGFGQQIEGIRTAMFSGFVRSLFFSLGCTLVFFLVLLPGRVIGHVAVRLCMPLLIVLLMALDLVMVGGKYVSYYDPAGMYRSNAVIDLLRAEKEYRTKFIPHTQGIFNLWNSILVPYFCFKSADMPAESRRNPDLDSFYTVVGQKPDRVWKLMGIKHFVVLKDFESELKKLFGDSIRTVKTFNLVQDSATMSVAPLFVEPPQQGRFVIMEYGGAIPCGRWYGKAVRVTFDNMMNMLSDPALDLDKILVVDEKDAGREATLSAESENSATGSCRLVEYTENTIKIETEANADGWVLVNDYFDRNWRASISGKDVPLVRADGVFRAVRMPAGSHVVSMVYRGNEGTFWVPVYVLAGLLMLAALSAIVALFRKGRMEQRLNAN